MQLSGGAGAVGRLSARGGGQAAALPRAAMLGEDVRTLLAASPPGVGQRGEAPGVSAPHVHPVLRERAQVGSWNRVSGVGRSRVGRAAHSPR